MTIIETPFFTKAVSQLIDEENYRDLQGHLIKRPEAGDLISGGGGIRKLRWSLKGTGKRGGLRIIYYWNSEDEILYMLLPYKKSKKEDLDPFQVKFLKNLVKENLK